MFGTKLVGSGGEVLWGSTRRLFWGPRLDGEAKARGLLDAFVLVPLLLKLDIYGGLLRSLEELGGYQTGRDLFVLEYDWRLGVQIAAAQLARLLEQLDPGREVDVVGFSSGGLVVRYTLGYGGADVLHASDAAAPSCALPRIGRVVFVGTPQRGSVTALIGFIEGLRLFPIGKRYHPHELASVQTCFDLLPHADDAVVLDEAEPPGLYQPEFWQGSPIWTSRSEWMVRLERARRLHDALAKVPAHPETFVIGARHVRTPARVQRCGHWLGWPGRRSSGCYSEGDGTVTLTSLLGMPGLETANRCRFATPALHQLLCSDPSVHASVVEMLAGDKPREDLS